MLEHRNTRKRGEALRWLELSYVGFVTSAQPCRGFDLVLRVKICPRRDRSGQARMCILEQVGTDHEHRLFPSSEARFMHGLLVRPDPWREWFSCGV